MRRFLLIALLPIIWAPLIALTAVVGPRLPWWGWLVAALLCTGLWLRWRRRYLGPVGEADPAAARFSPLPGGGL